MRVDRHSAAIIRDSQKAVCSKRDINPGGMARDRLIHRVVEDFREQVMERALVSAADIHAGTTANRLQPLKDFDILGGIIVSLLTLSV